MTNAIRVDVAVLTLVDHCPDPECPCGWRGYVFGRTVGHGGRGQDLKRRLVEAGKSVATWLYFVDTEEGREIMARRRRRREANMAEQRQRRPRAVATAESGSSRRTQ